MLDRGWLSVLCRQAWDPVRDESVELAQHLEMTPAPMHILHARAQLVDYGDQCIGGLDGGQRGQPCAHGG